MIHSVYGEYKSYKMEKTTDYSEAVDVRYTDGGFLVLDSDPLAFADFYYNSSFVRFNSGILYGDMNATETLNRSQYFIGWYQSGWFF